MQKDAVTVDLGTVMNRGFTSRQGAHLPEHDTFEVSVEVYLSDSAGAADGTSHEVACAAQFGEGLVVASESGQNLSKVYPKNNF